MRLWAICTTDGGRRDPKPLPGYIYASKNEARLGMDYFTWHRPGETFPIREINIEVVDMGGEE